MQKGDSFPLQGETLRVVIPAEDVAARIAELAADIEARYAGESVVAICVLKGAYMFFSDLLKHFRISPEVDFVRLSSYGNGTSRASEIHFTKDVEIPLRGRHVLVVEDIVDTGHTMSLLLKQLEARGAASLAVCSLVDKFERREVELKVDFPGFTLTKGFIVGYGMDFAEKYRHLDAIYELVR